MRQRELQIQKQAMRFLDAALPSYIRAIHIPNGGRRDARTGAMLKAAGVKAGVPDIALIKQGGAVAFIEIKTDKGRPSPAQEEWFDWFDQNSIPYAVCRSLGDVQTALMDWNIQLKVGGMK